MTQDKWTYEKMVAGIETRTWVDGGGRETPVRELSDEHLEALVEFLADKQRELDYWTSRLDRFDMETDTDEFDFEDPAYYRKKVEVFTGWVRWVPIIHEEIDRRRVVG